MPLTLKVVCHGEIRRAQLSGTGQSYGAVVELVCRLFQGMAEFPSSFTLRYEDDDGDHVTVSSDSEMAEAFRLATAAKWSSLRLTVVPKPSAAPTPTATVVEETDRKAADEWDFVPPATASGNKAASGMLQMILNLCATDKELQALASQPNIQAALQRAFSNDEMLRNPEAMESIMASLCESDPEFAAFHNLVTNKMNAQGPPAVHEGVTCDKSGMCPIVGNRYHKKGENYDLCEAEYAKLEEAEKALFETIARPHNEGMPPPMAGGGMMGMSDVPPSARNAMQHGMMPPMHGCPMANGGVPPMHGCPMANGGVPPMHGAMGSQQPVPEPNDMKEVIERICSEDPELKAMSEKTKIKNSLRTIFETTDPIERDEIMKALFLDPEFKAFFDRVNEKIQEFMMVSMAGPGGPMSGASSTPFGSGGQNPWDGVGMPPVNSGPGVPMMGSPFAPPGGGMNPAMMMQMMSQMGGGPGGMSGPPPMGMNSTNSMGSGPAMNPAMMMQMMSQMGGGPGGRSGFPQMPQMGGGPGGMSGFPQMPHMGGFPGGPGGPNPEMMMRMMAQMHGERSNAPTEENQENAWMYM